MKIAAHPLKAMLTLFRIVKKEIFDEHQEKNEPESRDEAIRRERERYADQVRKTAGAVGTNLYVGGKSIVTGNTFLGDNVNFNGMSIYGGVG